MIAKMTFAAGKHRRYVTQAQPVTSLPNLRSDYDRLMAGLALCEIVSYALPYEAPDEPHYDLILHGLVGLDASERWMPVLAWAELMLLVIEGRAPDWLECQHSGGRETENPSYVSPHAGGRIAADQAMLWRDSFQVSAEALIALNRMKDLDAPPSNLKPARDCLNVLHHFWQEILERQLKAGKALLNTIPNQSHS
jgi:DNA repair protein RecO